MADDLSPALKVLADEGVEFADDGEYEDDEPTTIIQAPVDTSSPERTS